MCVSYMEDRVLMPEDKLTKAGQPFLGGAVTCSSM